MNCIISISMIPQLLDSNLPKMAKKASTHFYYPVLYKGAMLSRSSLDRLQQQQSLIEIQFSEEEMLRYHQEFTRCDQHRRLTFEDYIAVAYAKNEACILLAEKGFLSRYALSKGIKVMSLRELEEHCLQRHRQVRSRKERLRSYFDDQKHITEEEPMQQPIDDDTTF